MISYIPGATQDGVALDIAQSFVGFQGGIDGHAYTYGFGSHDIKEPRLNPTSYDVPYTGTFDQFDRLLRIAEADVSARKPGKLVVDGWSRSAYIVGAKHTRHAKGRISTKLKVACVDGAWWKVSGVSLIPSGQGGTGDLDYPHDYGHDYGRGRSDEGVNTKCLVPCKPRIIFHGPVADPYVVIAGNRYQVMGDVASDAEIVIDGRDKTVRLIAANGDVTDKFASAVRGTGEDGGEYVFQPIPVGKNTATWDGTFTVEVQWYEEVGEVPWSRY